MAPAPYVGPRLRARPEELHEYQSRGWLLEEKSDGCYVQVVVGANWRAPCPKCGPAYQTGIFGPKRLDHRFAHNQRRHGAIAGALYRSGRSATMSLGPLHGLELGVPDGTVLAGELMERTDAAARWCGARSVPVGLVLFDVLRWGDEDLAAEPYLKRRGTLDWLAGGLPEQAQRFVTVAPAYRDRFRDRYESIIASGGEGVVIKDPGASAGARRGAFKVKRHDNLDVRVLAIEEQTLLVEWGAGRTFRVTRPAFPVTVGGFVECKHVGLTTRDLPRHCVAVRPRDDISAPA